MMKFLIPLTILIGVFACQSPVEQPLQSNNQFADDTLRIIYDLQDRRESAELLPYFEHENENYRAVAVEAFASIQDTTQLAQISKLLGDPSTKVRTATAYTLGQSHHLSAEEFIMNGLYIEDTLSVRKVLLEALGKCIAEENINYFSSYQSAGVLEDEGVAWGMYRAGLRGYSTDSMIYRATTYLHPDYSYETRFAAAQFLSRLRDADISNSLDSLITSALFDKSPMVRMAATSALRNDKSEKTITSLTEKIAKDSDYRVRINALRTISRLDFGLIKQTLLTALSDENVNVAITAASILSRTARADDFEELLEQAKANKHWRVSAALYEALIKLKPTDKALVEEVQAKFTASTNPYEKAQLLYSLSESFIAYEFIVDQTFNSEIKAISTSGITAIANMASKENCPAELAAPLAEVFKNAIATGDLAMIGTATSTISNPDLGYKALYSDFSFLHTAKSKLTLPKDNEGMQSLQSAIDYFEDNESATPVANAYNHPIDWALVQTIKSNQKVKVSTSKGDVIFTMLVDKAPGSVANFVALAQEGYYNGKNFHRVVPNFVAQGGCNRGDGWGGEAYSIRSEFANLKYGEGYVGMASAGKDTEGTQWFITHSPTPHLDGRYTIFARVYEGMEVVHQLEVGDLIKEVVLL